MKTKMCKSEIVTIEVRYPPMQETHNSWLLFTTKITATNWKDLFWFPKSQCDLSVIDENNNIGKLTIPKWLLNKIIK